MFPLLTFDAIPLGEANRLLVAWSHKMGPMNRPMGRQDAHALIMHDGPVAVVCTADLVAETVGSAPYLNRGNCIELARVCAVSRDWNRVAVRLWRNVVFPLLAAEYAVSYQDAVLHSGDLYRFDGWKKVGFSHSGTDARSGRKGRDKFIWVWPQPA
jgi:antitoxin VapB